MRARVLVAAAIAVPVLLGGIVVPAPGARIGRTTYGAILVVGVVGILASSPRRPPPPV